MELNVNGERRTVEVDPSTPLLWVLRDALGLTGTKYGCGMAQCGACTVHVDGRAMRSCVLPASAVAGRPVTTIEGLLSEPGAAGAPAAAAGAHGKVGRVLARAWTELEVPQCGWCQTGQVMSAAVLLAEAADPTDADIDVGMSGNVCRCATYVRIRKAIHRAAELLREGGR